MKPDQLLRAILPEVLMDNFDIDRFEKSDTRFDIWLDEKKEGQRIFPVGGGNIKSIVLPI